jgi:hypothetical protein
VKVRIAVPNTGWIHKFVTGYLMKIQGETYGHELSFDLCTDVPADQTRNKIIKHFLEEPEQQTLIMIDADNPPMVNCLDLVSRDLDIVILPTPVWSSKFKSERSPIYWNCMDWDNRDGKGWREHLGTTRLSSGVHVSQGVEKIDAGGSGAIVIARRVLEVVKPAFMREYNEHGLITKGSDFYFCQRAEQAGFKVWASYDHTCRHFKEVELGEVYEEFMGLQAAAMEARARKRKKYVGAR